MGAPQIIWFIIAIIDIVYTGIHNGERKEGEYNFWTNLLAIIIEYFFFFFLGFFK